jgi:5'-nucleotidase
MSNRFQILITNDDGFEASGLRALREALLEIADVVVVAPTIEKSASGHSLTLTRPLHFVELEENFYKLDDGTPSDCVFLALRKLFKEKKPDLVISGINRGANMGEDITYSGTVGGAMEGVLQGVPSIAISQVCGGDCKKLDELKYRVAQSVIVEIIEQIKESGFPLGERKLLNINIPPLHPEDFRGVKTTYAGHRLYGNDAQIHINPRGKEYFWIGLPRLEWESREVKRGGLISDFEAVERGFASITPIHLDLTSYDDINRVESWL